MIRLTGTTLLPGLFIGTARLISQGIQQIPSRKITAKEVNGEIEALQSALNAIEAEINLQLDNPEINDAESDILQAHLMILRDPELEKDLLFSIETELLSAPAAVQKVFDSVCRQFREMKNDYFAQRVADYKDVAQRVISSLIGVERGPLREFLPTDIAILEEISPSTISLMARAGLKAYISQTGSVNSHAAILSRALGVISLAAVPKLVETVKDGDTLILDAGKGFAILDPDAETLTRYTELLAGEALKAEALQSLNRLPAVTSEGERIQLYANIEIPAELEGLIAANPDGIGLFRTEFLYLERPNLPSELEQYDVYRLIVSRLNPRPVTIRTFDLGGDKVAGLMPSEPEENPYLGNRGFRFSVTRPDIFRTQLRAILRASVCGKVRVMFPMIIDANDYLRARDIVYDVMKELDAEGIGYDPEIMLGSMIEVPSAALCADELARVCDFLSIGTNDLVQYCLATDRNNAAIASYYVEHHPAVIKLIRMVIHSAGEHGIPLSVCGEMASTPQYIPLLLGLGINALSVNTHQIARTRAIIRNCDARLHELLGDPAKVWTLAELDDLIKNEFSQILQIRSLP
ncbi:MAG TPA: phosphoenolpyruvate--protein phosphotransferase [Candidatus Cloacimonadota bacterium]|nr:phosphoenolpyruvate--protein phosphotransferase [Candidatus Cloacimonadota bacterium]HPS39387.1 phosphoenolpyruvate--protein phosphotransferase [Candidatus Cloacimonadota bacterium]